MTPRDKQHVAGSVETVDDGHLWVIEGLRSLATDGIAGVKVERLATALGISKGPFYWRFSGRTQLLEAMLSMWKQEFTAYLIEQSAQLEHARARMERLVENSLVAKWRGTDVARVEGAIRAWAAQDPKAGKVVREVDRQRVAYLVKELGLLGVSPADAEAMAKGIYLGLLGLYTTRQYTPDLADDAAFCSLVRVCLDHAESMANLAKPKTRR